MRTYLNPIIIIFFIHLEEHFAAQTTPLWHLSCEVLSSTIQGTDLRHLEETAMCIIISIVTDRKFAQFIDLPYSKCFPHQMKTEEHQIKGKDRKNRHNYKFLLLWDSWHSMLW